LSSARPIAPQPTMPIDFTLMTAKLYLRGAFFGIKIQRQATLGSA
jgi:hypothetical protein